MKLYKSIIQNIISNNFDEIYLPDTTKEGDKIIIKKPDSSQVFNVRAILADESVIVGEDNEQ